MSSTKRLLFSATGLLLSAGPGVAATQGSTVSVVRARDAHQGDDNTKRDDTSCEHDRADDTNDDRTPTSGTTTTSVRAKGVASGAGDKLCVRTTRPRTTTTKTDRPRGRRCLP